jgi:hypothetical protein
MSGTAALAAARKRRANPQPNVNVNANSSPASNTNSYNSNLKSLDKDELPKPTNPAMLLMQHNMLIQRLQKDIADLKNETKEIKRDDFRIEIELIVPVNKLFCKDAKGRLIKSL